MTPGDGFFEDLAGGADPARLSESADRAADPAGPRRARRDGGRGRRAGGPPRRRPRAWRPWPSCGPGAPADSLAGCLWRLYLLRSWVYADPTGAAAEFEAGRTRAPVARVVAGVADPPGPEELKTMVDQVLRGIAEGDFADVLFRAGGLRPGRRHRTGRACPTDDQRRRPPGCSCWPSSSRAPATWKWRTGWCEPLDSSPSAPGRGSPGSQIKPLRAATRREALPVRRTRVTPASVRFMYGRP